jgi:hypothetical protein
MISRIKSYFNDDYMESRSTARFLAKYFAPLFFPVYLYFRLKNYVFLTNTFPGVGHIVPEIDNFLRKKFLSEIPENKKYIFLYKNHSIPFEFSQNYSHFFYKCIVNSKIYALLSPLLIRFPSITLDSGFALIKYYKFKDLTYQESLK